MYANGDTEEMLGRVLEGRDGISVTGAPADQPASWPQHASLLAAPALTLAPPLPLRIFPLGTHCGLRVRGCPQRQRPTRSTASR